MGQWSVVRPERVRYTFRDWRPAGRSFRISTDRSFATDTYLARRGFLRHSGLSGQSGCHTTYRPSNYTRPSGKFGAPLHHPQFLEWIGEPDSARLLEMGPGRWLHSLSCEQAMDAVLQLSAGRVFNDNKL